MGKRRKRQLAPDLRPEDIPLFDRTRRGIELAERLELDMAAILLPVDLEDEMARTFAAVYGQAGMAVPVRDDHHKLGASFTLHGLPAHVDFATRGVQILSRVHYARWRRAMDLPAAAEALAVDG